MNAQNEPPILRSPLLNAYANTLVHSGDIVLHWARGL